MSRGWGLEKDNYKEDGLPKLEKFQRHEDPKEHILQARFGRLAKE